MTRRLNSNEKIICDGDETTVLIEKSLSDGSKAYAVGFDAEDENGTTRFVVLDLAGSLKEADSLALRLHCKVSSADIR